MIRAILAFLASVITAVQAFFIYVKGQTICFNNGCAIVDSLTTISPLYFNIAGFVFFQILFWCLLWGRDGSEHWHKFARLLLSAGLSTEAVLIFFQYSIAGVFCSYCMVIFSVIVLLNVLSGFRQIFRGIVLFSAVMAGCLVVQFRADGGAGASLDAGSVAVVAGEKNEAKLYLFFSSTCTHCENVIESLRGDNSCTIHFNPIERIQTFAFPEAERFVEYNPGINLNFMNSLAIKEIPVLVSIEQQRTLVLKGERQIIDYLKDTCRKSKEVDYGGSSSVPPISYQNIPGLDNQQDDACPVTGECDPEVSGEAVEKE